MNADLTNKATGVLRTASGFARVFVLNTMRRGLILGRYTLICLQQQRLRCAQRRLGRAVLAALEQGEVNPMLAEGVKDALAKAWTVKAGKDKHYQAIAAIREKIRAACVCRSPVGEGGQPPEGGPSGPQGG